MGFIPIWGPTCTDRQMDGRTNGRTDTRTTDKLIRVELGNLYSVPPGKTFTSNITLLLTCYEINPYCATGTFLTLFL